MLPSEAAVIVWIECPTEGVELLLVIHEEDRIGLTAWVLKANVMPVVHSYNTTVTARL